MMLYDWLAVLVGAVVGAAVVALFWLNDIVRRELDDDEDRFGPY